MEHDDWKLYFDSLKKEDWESARKAIKKISDGQIDNPNVHLKLGDTYRRAGDVAKAIVSYHRSARLFGLKGFTQKALAVYKIVLRLDPHDDGALCKSNELLTEMESARGLPAPPEPAIAPTKESERVDAPAGGPQDHVEVPEAPVVSSVPELFKGMTEDGYSRMLDELETNFFLDGEKVVEEGDSGDSMYVIKSGRARVVAHLLGREIELARLGEGDLFGEVAFLTGRPRTASVIADGVLEVCEIARLDVETIIEKNPSALARLDEFYRSRVADTIGKVVPRQEPK